MGNSYQAGARHGYRRAFITPASSTLLSAECPQWVESGRSGGC